MWFSFPSIFVESLETVNHTGGILESNFQNPPEDSRTRVYIKFKKCFPLEFCTEHFILTLHSDKGFSFVKVISPSVVGLLNHLPVLFVDNTHSLPETSCNMFVDWKCWCCDTLEVMYSTRPWFCLSVCNKKNFKSDVPQCFCKKKKIWIFIQGCLLKLKTQSFFIAVTV